MVNRALYSIDDLDRPSWKEDIEELLYKVHLMYGDRDYPCNWYGVEAVYDAGHEIAAFQPETAYQIFQRVIFDKDVATGKISTRGNGYMGTKGPLGMADIKNKVPVAPKPTCYTLSPDTCTNEQWDTVLDGTALIKNWIVVDENTKHLFPDTLPPKPTATKGPKGKGKGKGGPPMCKPTGI